MQQLSTWLVGFPGLIWSVDIPRSRLRVFNQWPFPGLDAPRLLKDAPFRKKTVRREDYPLLVEFWDMLGARLPAAVSFHVNGVASPLIIQGWPGPDELYSGLLKEAFLPATYASGGFPGTCQMHLGGAGYPVFAFDAATGAILTANEAAGTLFGAGASLAKGGFFLADIVPGGRTGPLREAGEKALEEDVWAGTLTFGNAQGSTFRAKVRLTPCGGGGAVRVALLNIPDSGGAAVTLRTEDDGFDGVPLREGLERLYARHAEELDGLMFSDIRSARGRVVVHGVGPAFRNLDWGAVHAYEGTIAQDIERFGLHSLTVDETLDSIKTIDWVLFTPHGVRSYFAKPFYGPSGLHAVLILASLKPGTFGPDAERRFADIMYPFESLVASWRKTSAGDAEGKGNRSSS